MMQSCSPNQSNTSSLLVFKQILFYSSLDCGYCYTLTNVTILSQLIPDFGYKEADSILSIVRPCEWNDKRATVPCVYYRVANF